MRYRWLAPACLLTVVTVAGCSSDEPDVNGDDIGGQQQGQADDELGASAETESTGQRAGDGSWEEFCAVAADRPSVVDDIVDLDGDESADVGLRLSSAHVDHLHALQAVAPDDIAEEMELLTAASATSSQRTVAMVGSPSEVYLEALTGDPEPAANLMTRLETVEEHALQRCERLALGVADIADQVASAPVDVDGTIAAVRCDGGQLHLRFIDPDTGQDVDRREVDLARMSTPACGNTALNQSPVSRQVFSSDLRYVTGTVQDDDGASRVLVIDTVTGQRTDVSSYDEDDSFAAEIGEDHAPAFDAATDVLLFHDANADQVMVAEVDDDWRPQSWDGVANLASQGFIVIRGADAVMARDDTVLRAYHPDRLGDWVLRDSASGGLQLVASDELGNESAMFYRLGEADCSVREWLGPERFLCVGHTQGPGSVGDLQAIIPTDKCDDHDRVAITDAPDRQTLDEAASPDGTQVAFLSRRADDVGLYVTEVDDSGAVAEPAELDGPNSDIGDWRLVEWLGQPPNDSGLNCS